MSCPNCDKVKKDAWAVVDDCVLDVQNFKQAVTGEVKKLQTKNDKLREDNKKWKELLEQVIPHMENLQNENIQLKDAKALVDEEYRKAEEKIEELQTQITGLKQENKGLKQENKALNECIKSLNNKIDKLDKTKKVTFEKNTSNLKQPSNPNPNPNTNFNQTWPSGCIKRQM